MNIKIKELEDSIFETENLYLKEVSKNSKLKEGFKSFLKKYEQTKTIHMGQSYEVSTSQFLYKSDIDKLRELIEQL